MHIGAKVKVKGWKTFEDAKRIMPLGDFTGLIGMVYDVLWSQTQTVAEVRFIYQDDGAEVTEILYINVIDLEIIAIDLEIVD